MITPQKAEIKKDSCYPVPRSTQQSLLQHGSLRSQERKKSDYLANFSERRRNLSELNQLFRAESLVPNASPISLTSGNPCFSPKQYECNSYISYQERQCLVPVADHAVHPRTQQSSGTHYAYQPAKGEMMETKAYKAVVAFLGSCKDNGLKAEDVHTAFCNAFHITRSEKIVWCVVTNTDLTEGRGYSYVKHVCDLEPTAKRLAKKAGVMGSDATVQPMKAYLIGNCWYYPSEVTLPTQADEQEEKSIQAIRAAQEKARSLGMTDSDIALLQKDGAA